VLLSNFNSRLQWAQLCVPEALGFIKPVDFLLAKIRSIKPIPIKITPIAIPKLDLMLKETASAIAPAVMIQVSPPFLTPRLRLRRLRELVYLLRIFAPYLFM
jgi:hypothetical protein